MSSSTSELWLWFIHLSKIFTDIERSLRLLVDFEINVKDECNVNDE